MYSFALSSDNDTNSNLNITSDTSKSFIKWVDFNVSYDALNDTSKLDISSHSNDSDVKYNWIELLAFLACKNGGNFKNYKKSDLDFVVSKLDSGCSMSDLSRDFKHYDYFF